MSARPARTDRGWEGGEVNEVYRGHAINVSREMSLGGDMLLYFSVYRESDGYECEASFTSGDDTVEDYVRYMRERIDAELLDDDPWGEKAGW